MHTKRIAAGYGKRPKWVVTPRGPHEKANSIPVMLLLRDLLGYADNAREAKRILNEGLVLVDKKVCKDPKYAVGLMDVIEIPKTNEYFRVLPAKKGYYLKSINKAEAAIKPCKIVDKTIVDGGKVQVNLHDGKNLIVDKGVYKTRDTLILEIPAGKIKEHISFDLGCDAIISKGRHRGVSGKIKEISRGTMIQKSITQLDDLQTLTDYIFVIGKDKALIEV